MLRSLFYRSLYLLLASYLILDCQAFSATSKSTMSTSSHPFCDLPGDPSLILTTNVDLGDSKLQIMKDISAAIAKHAGKKLVPASILKIFTSLAALHYLGSNHRYATDFFRDPDSNLVIKGYGDPLMISEIVDQIARELAGLIGDAGSVTAGRQPSADSHSPL